MFILVHDLNDGLVALVNSDDVSRIEERTAGCCIYFKTVSSDFDKSIHQVVLPVAEKFDEIWKQLNAYSLVSWVASAKKKEEQ